MAMVRPLHPLMEYYANYDYIANVLCENKDKPALSCNGKCYLVKQAKKNNPVHSHDATIPLINMDAYPISLVNWINYELQLYPISNDANFGKIAIHTQKKLSVLLKPPLG